MKEKFAIPAGPGWYGLNYVDIESLKAALDDENEMRSILTPIIGWWVDPDNSYPIGPDGNEQFVGIVFPNGQVEYADHRFLCLKDAVKFILAERGADD